MPLRSSLLYNVLVLAGVGGPPGVVCVGVHHAPHHGGLHIRDQRALPQGSTRRLPLHLPRPRHPSGNHTAKTPKYRKFETDIPRKGIARPQSQLILYIHVSVRDFYIPTIGLPILRQENYMDQSWEYINRSQTRECENWDCRIEVEHKNVVFGLSKLTFNYSAHSYYPPSRFHQRC